MPPRFEYDYKEMKSAAGEPLASTTVAVYKAHLNRLAKKGYTTKDDLLKKQKEIVKLIETESSLQMRRVILSAVFKVLDSVTLEKKKEYYEAFQRAKHQPKE